MLICMVPEDNERSYGYIIAETDIKEVARQKVRLFVVDAALLSQINIARSCML